jgi:proline racemase
MNFHHKVTAIDLHACGEPGRVITGGVGDVPGKTMFEKKTYLETHMDDLRLRMLRSLEGIKLRTATFCCHLRFLAVMQGS